MIKISALLFFNCVPTLSLSDKCFRRSAVSMVNQWFRQNSKSQVSTWPEKKLTMARKIHGACTISRIKNPMAFAVPQPWLPQDDGT